MKEPPAVIQLVQAKCIQLNQHAFTKKKVRTQGYPAPLSKPLAAKVLPKQVNEQQRPLLPFPITSSVRVLRQRTIKGLRRIESQAERINQLSAELEVAVLELKEIASEVNRDWRAFQAIQQPTIDAIAKRDISPSFACNICEYQVANVPNVQQKPSGSFLLSSRSIDLFKAEREAALLAQTLRRRTKRKQIN
jgi:hypothetical protein